MILKIILQYDSLITTQKNVSQDKCLIFVFCSVYIFFFMF